MKVITTIPPYAPFIAEVAGHPIMSGVRLNTVMPIKNELLGEMLTRIKGLVAGKDIWIDLKCRQIRTCHGSLFFNTPKEVKSYKIGDKTYILDPSSPKAYGDLRTPPWAELKISRKIKLDLSKGPVKCYLQDGYDSAQIVEIVDGDKLIMLDGPKRVVGGGESINILDPSLEIEGYFTDMDLQYIEAAKKAGIHTYMLSYVEQESDVKALLGLDPEAKILVKIESKKGLDWVNSTRPWYGYGNPNIHIMVARGDLYVEMGRPDKILKPLKQLVGHDSEAVLASRILTSLRKSSRPTCSDITDIACMLEMGYKHFMIGDDICFDHDVLMLAIETLSAIDRNYRR